MSLFNKLKNIFSYDEPKQTQDQLSREEDKADREALRQSFQQEEEQVDHYDKGLEKSRKSFSRRINELLANFRYIDEEFFDDVEDMLIESDVGFEATLEISDVLREEAAIQNVTTVEQAEELIVSTIVDMYERHMPADTELNIQENELTVILFVGVNGVGKTTTIAKLAHHYIEEGKKITLAAGDTFRAGAIEQLHVWGDRVGADVVSSQIGGDPAAVVFDGIAQAKANNSDILLVDTAGRLQNKKNLMNELDKMNRVIQREIPNAPHEVLLVLDATTGQNALSQAKEFANTTDVTGIVLTKMDGTARGGIVLAIGKELGIPVKFVGFGESMDDLRPFHTEHFALGLFSEMIEETV